MKKKNSVKSINENKFRVLFKIILSLTVIIWVLNTLWLIYPNFFRDYPYMFSDSWAILTDSFYYLGYNYNFIAKNAGLPLIAAFLIKYDYMSLLPVFNQLAFALLLYTTYKLLVELKISRLSSMVVVFFISVSYFMQLYTVTILTDVYAVALMSLSILAFKKTDQDKRYFLLVALAAYLSLNFQYAAYVLGASYILYVLVFRREILKEKYLYIGSIVFSPLILWWYLFRYIEFGDPNYTQIVQFELLTPHLSGIPFYTFNAIAIMGLPLAIVTLVGIIRTITTKIDNFLIFISIFTFCTFVFWVVMYDWLDSRFLMYFITPVAIFAGLGLDSILRVMKNLKIEVQYSALIAGLIICTYYLQYNPPAKYWQNNILLLPGLGSYFETGTTKRQGIEGHYTKWHIVTFPNEKKNFGIIDIAYKRLKYSRNTPAGLEEYAQLTDAANKICNNCHLCLHPKTTLNNYFYRNKLTIYLNKQVDGVCDSDDIPIIESGNKVDGKILYEGQGYTLLENDK